DSWRWFALVEEQDCPAELNVWVRDFGEVGRGILSCFLVIYETCTQGQVRVQITLSHIFLCKGKKNARVRRCLRNRFVGKELAACRQARQQREKLVFFGICDCFFSLRLANSDCDKEKRCVHGTFPR